MEKNINLPEYATMQIAEDEKARFRLLFCESIGHFLANKPIPKSKDRKKFLFFYEQGLKYFKEGIFNGALRMFFMLQKEHPFFWGLYRYVGVIFGMKGEDEKHAIDYITFSNDLLGTSNMKFVIEGIYYKALIHTHLNNHEKALEIVKRLIDNAPNFKEIDIAENICYLGVLNNLQILNIKDAEYWARKAIEIGKPNSSLLIIIANYYLSNNMFEKAYEYYSKALNFIEEKKAFIPWIDRIVNQKSFDNKLIIEKHSALCGIAGYYDYIGQTDEALKFYTDAITIREHSFTGNLGLSSIYALLGDSYKMKNYLSQGLQFFKANDSTHQLIINSLIINDNFRNRYLRNEMLEILVDKGVIHRYLYRQAKKIKFIGAEQELEELLVLISRGEIKQVFKYFLSKIPYNSNNELIHLKSRYSALVSDNNAGILGRDVYELELNKIVKALIDFIGNELDRTKI